MTSIEHIVNCISHAPSLDNLSSVKDDAWDDIAVMAIALGLAPLLHWRLDQANVVLPPTAMAKLAVTRKAHAKRNQAIAEQLSEILAECGRHQVKVVALKGALLAPMVYEDMSLRPMNDIDLLFQTQDLAQVNAILESLGYSGKHKNPDQGPGIVKHLSTYRRDGNQGATPNPYLSANSDRTVEPHGSLEESWFGLKVDITPGVWERARPITLHRQPAYRLSATDMALHLSIHATFHVIMGASVFVQLYDIGQVIRKWSHEIEWEQLVSLSQQTGAAAFVYAGFFWAKRLYKISVPETVLAGLKSGCDAKLLDYIHRLDANDLVKRTQHPPLVTLPQRVQRGFIDRREAARWAGSLKAKWRVWQTALAFHKTDTVNLLTQKLRTTS